MLIAALTFALAAAPVPAKPVVPKPFTFVTSVEGLNEYSLPNGLRVIFVPDPSKPTVTVNMTIFVGSRHEDYGEKGMAHLLEHLLFKGTPSHKDPKKEISDRGAEANGTTWFDRTNYYETVNATDANLEWAIRFEADRLVNSFVAKKDLDSEMTVVRNEYEMGENDPKSVLVDRAVATAFVWHNYGGTTIGARSDLESVPIEKLQGFYKRHYQPNNAQLVIAGKFDEAKAFKWIADSFGKLKPVGTPRATYTREPTQDGEKSVTVRRVGGVPVLLAAYHVPSGTDPDYAAVDVLAEVLGDAPSGRLYDALVTTKKVAHVGCESFQLKEPGVLFCLADLKTGDPVAEARATLLSTIEGLAAKPVTKEQTERAKAGVLKQLELVLNASERIGLVLSEAAALGDWRMLFLHRDRLKAVTADDVNRVAAKYLKASNRTLGEYVPTEKPERAEIPDVPDVTAMLKGYVGDATMASGEAFDSSPENLGKAVKTTDFDGTLKIATLSKKTRGQRVNAVFTLRFGTLESLQGKRAISDLTARLLQRGTKKHTRQQFSDALDKLNAQLHITGAPQGLQVSLEVRRPQLAEAVALVFEALKEPAFDAKELEALKREVLTDVEQRKADPVQLGLNTLQRSLVDFPKGHPLGVPTFEEVAADTQAVTVEQLKAFHASHYGAQAATVAFVGDIDDNEVRDLVRDGLKGWIAPQAFARVASPHKELPAKKENIDTPDKQNAFYGMGAKFSLKDSDADYPAMAMADFLLGGGFLNGRIPLRLREKEGLSYGAGTMLKAPPIDDSGVLLGYAIYAPQNVEKVEAGFREELEKAIAKGFTDAEVKAAGPAMLQGRTQSRADDADLAGQLSQQLYLKRSWAFEADLDKKVGALTAKDVSAALKKFVDPAKVTWVKAGDFKKVAPPK